MMKPSTLSDFFTFTLFSLGGIFVFGELGMLVGASRAKSTISQDPESRRRIEAAFSKFRADVLRKEAAALERGIETGEKGPGFAF
jgi:hypothetical protein